MSLSTRLRDISTYRKLAKEATLAGVTVRHIPEAELVRRAQELHAEVYLSRNFVSPHHIGADGRLTLDADPHQMHSDYYAAIDSTNENSGILALARQIRVKHEVGINSLPLLNIAHIYPGARSKLEKLDAVRCVEISALAKSRGQSSLLPLLLYRAMFRRSLQLGDEAWIMACDVRLFERLKLLFGSAIIRIGTDTPYQGADAVPALIALDEAVINLQRGATDLLPIRRTIRQYVCKFFLDGLPNTNLGINNGR